MARVARIVPEFCACVTPRNHATPCSRCIKEFLGRGPFGLFNCCTDVAVCGAYFDSDDIRAKDFSRYLVNGCVFLLSQRRRTSTISCMEMRKAMRVFGPTGGRLLQEGLLCGTLRTEQRS